MPQGVATAMACPHIAGSPAGSARSDRWGWRRLSFDNARTTVGHRTWVPVQGELSPAVRGDDDDRAQHPRADEQDESEGTTRPATGGMNANRIEWH
jgi:hypothetical protein